MGSNSRQLESIAAELQKRPYQIFFRFSVRNKQNERTGNCVESKCEKGKQRIQIFRRRKKNEGAYFGMVRWCSPATMCCVWKGDFELNIVYDKICKFAQFYI